MLLYPVILTLRREWQRYLNKASKDTDLKQTEKNELSWTSEHFVLQIYHYEAGELVKWVKVFATTGD